MDFSNISKLLIAVFFASIPALIWLRIWKSKKQTRKAKKYVLLVFLLGTLSILPVLFINYLWKVFPDANVLNVLKMAHIPQEERLMIWFMIIAMLEEIAKFLVLLFVDKSKKLVVTVHDAIKYSVVAALGFAFAENLYYFYSLGQMLQVHEFLGIIAFRSMITVCGHLTFSGIFGHYYGMSKFAKTFALFEHWRNASKLDKSSPNKKELLRKARFFRFGTIFKGLVFAVMLHAIFNFFLELGEVRGVLWLILGAFMMLIYLYRQRTGYINLHFRDSNFDEMSPRDQDVVFELMGVRYSEEKHDEVMGICKRLLEKDKENPVVQLFLYKSVDRKRFHEAYVAVKRLFSRSTKL